jgi:hypothetical protein
MAAERRNKFLQKGEEKLKGDPPKAMGEFC